MKAHSLLTSFSLNRVHLLINRLVAFIMILFDKRNFTFSREHFCKKSLFTVFAFMNSSSLSFWNALHVMRKCVSSSTPLRHRGQTRFF